MIQKITSPLITTNNNTNFEGKKNGKFSHAFDREVDRSLVMRDLTALGLITLGVIGFVKHKHKINLQNINEIKFLNQAVANQSVYSTKSRDLNVLNNYLRHIADKKAAVLKYKLDNRMFIGKSPKVMKHIKNNLTKLQLQAI